MSYLMENCIHGRILDAYRKVLGESTAKASCGRRCAAIAAESCGSKRKTANESDGGEVCDAETLFRIWCGANTCKDGRLSKVGDDGTLYGTAMCYGEDGFGRHSIRVPCDSMAWADVDVEYIKYLGNGKFEVVFEEDDGEPYDDGGWDENGGWDDNSAELSFSQGIPRTPKHSSGEHAFEESASSDEEFSTIEPDDFEDWEEFRNAVDDGNEGCYLIVDEGLLRDQRYNSVVGYEGSLVEALDVVSNLEGGSLTSVKILDDCALMRNGRNSYVVYKLNDRGQDALNKALKDAGDISYVDDDALYEIVNDLNIERLASPRTLS
jgi:hypothetical protein